MSCTSEVLITLSRSDLENLSLLASLFIKLELLILFALLALALVVKKAWNALNQR